MSYELILYDPAVVDRAVTLLRTEHSAAVARSSRGLDEARELAIRGDIEPVSGAWSTTDRFWVHAQHSEHRYQVTTGSNPRCDCPDFDRTKIACKHIWAVNILCLVRFRIGYVPALEQEAEAVAGNDEDDVQDRNSEADPDEADVIGRAIQDLEDYAQRIT